MHAELTRIPTNSLIDMLFEILNRDLEDTSNDVTEIEQIQRELQRRGSKLEFLHRELHQAPANADATE